MPTVEKVESRGHDLRAEGARRAFERDYDVVVADTQPLRDAAFALRHEVYARELGFEPVRADGLERDAHDDRALHYLLRHRPTGEPAGCVRLVLAGEHDLPCEAVAPPPLEGAPIDPRQLPRPGLGEISRLTVAPHFRGTPTTGVPAAVGVALMTLAASAEAGLHSALCMMKPSLHAQLASIGIHLTQLSPLVDYHGGRALFHLDPERACPGVRPELQGILADIRASLASAGALRAA